MKPVLTRVGAWASFCSLVSTRLANTNTNIGHSLQGHGPDGSNITLPAKGTSNFSKGQYINPTILSSNTTETMLSYIPAYEEYNTTTLDISLPASLGEMIFKLPTNINWVKSVQQMLPGPYVAYLRSDISIQERRGQGSCTDTLDVLAYLMNILMNEEKEDNHILMVAYGDLIHIHREGDFLNHTTGKFFDDDIDMFVSYKTLVRLGTLEPELFRKFGWFMRYFVSRHGNHVIVAQLIASCRHKVWHQPEKAKSEHTVIELYPIVTIPGDEGKHGANKIVRDVWQGSRYVESMIFPPKHMTLVSKGASEPLNLQVPNKPEQLLECIYGNWKIPSGKHALAPKTCGH